MKLHIIIDIMCNFWYNIHGENMKNIKMITFHNAENYGATLQAYALKQTLKKINNKVSFVNYINKDVLKDYLLIRTNSFKSFISSIWYLPRNLKRKKSFRAFINKYLDGASKSYYNKKDIEQDINNEDIFVAGSDQIFNPILTNGLSDVYTLNFGKDNKKIIYGASVGNEEALEKYSEDFHNKLQSVDRLSVREEAVIAPLEKITNKKVEKVIDPTLLLEKEEWDSLVNENNVTKIKGKYILVYTLFETPEITKIANYISEKTGLKVVHFRKYNAYKKELLSLYKKGPADFVNAFKNAEYVITNSFHGLVFSIIFNRKFYAVMPNERAGRLKNLLDDLKLQKRCVSTYDEFLKKDINENIDYTKAEEIIKKLKQSSLEFLEQSINMWEDL